MSNKGKYSKKIIVVSVLMALIVGVLAYNIYGYSMAYRSIPMSEALEDYDYMWEKLESNYPLFSVANRKVGADKDRIKTDYRQNLLSNGDNIALKDFYSLLSSCINEFGYTGHLAVFDPVTFNRISKTVEDFYNMPQEETGFEKEFAKCVYGDMLEDKTKNTYRDLGFGIKGILTNNSTSSFKNLYMAEYGEDTAYLSISTFDTEYIGKDKNNLLKWFEENRDKKNIIIDMTRNNGGNDYYWITNIVAPNISKPLTSVSYALAKDGEDINDIFSVSGIREFININELRSLPSINEDDLEGIDYVWKNSLTVEPIYDEPILKGDIYLLVDESTYSSADGFALFCKYTGFATLVGSRSGGDGGVGITPVVRALPNTGLLMFYRICNTLNADGSSNMEYGVNPDIPMQGSKTPLGTCLNYLKLDYYKPKNIVRE